MPALDIRTDLRKPPQLFNHAEVVESDITAVGRMPHGMQGGNSSVAVVVKFREPLYTKDGRKITHGFCETSLKLFAQANEIFAAAEEVAKTAGGN